MQSSRRACTSESSKAGDQRMQQSRHEISTRLMGLDAEIGSVVHEMERMKTLHKTLVSERQALEKELQMLQRKQPGCADPSSSSRVHNAHGSVDYMTSQFDWSGELRARMLKVFGIKDFRLCQEG